MHSKRKRWVRTSAYIGLLSVSAYTGVSAVYALRDNNIRSGELYLALQKADESGVGVTEALQSLQLHVTSHMNASPLPQLGDNAPVQLNKSFERAKQAESARATADRERVNAEAIASCEAQFGRSSLVVRTQCVANYTSPNPAVAERTIVPELYKYDFVSPSWTPDRAGWLIVVTAVLVSILLLQIVSRFVVNSLMKQ
jgi:hypothetical protein